MSAAVIAACVGILLVLVYVTAQPLFGVRRRAAIQTSRAWRGMQLVRRRDQLYAAIKELEFDESLGKVEEEDYASQRQSLEAEAVAVLAELDVLQADVLQQADADSGGDGMVERVERDLAVLVSGRDPFPRSVKYCPSCGTKRGETDRFCVECGHCHEDGGHS